MNNGIFGRNLYLFGLGAALLAAPAAWSAVDSMDAPAGGEGSSLTDQYPALKMLTFEEPDSGVHLGFGLNPFGMQHNQLSMGANFFQFHWMTQSLDWEVFSVSYGMTMTSDDSAKSRAFTLRTVPKYRISRYVSVGPLLGYEFVSFPNLNSEIYNGALATPTQPFSSAGWVYGGAVSEMFPIGDGFLFKLNQTVYQETYSTTTALNGWQYHYDTASLNGDQSPIAPSTVFQLEFSLLY